MFTVKVYVTYKESILDPQGEAICKAIKNNLSIDTVDEVRMGKYFEIKMNTTDKAIIQETIEKVADQLLVNVTMETYSYEIEEA